MRHAIELPVSAPRVAEALDEVQAFLEEGGVRTELALEMRLIGEEALTNIVKYAGASSIQVILDLDEDAVVLELRDDGRPFDLLAASRPDLDASLEDRPVGGLGIHLMHSLCNEVHSTREDDTNVLRLTKKR